MGISIDDQIKAVSREIAIREQVYPQWVRSGRRGFTQQKADHEIAAMKAVAESLHRLKGLED